MFEELLVTATALTGVFGSMTAFMGLKAFKRGRDGSLLYTAAGFGFITVGTIVGTVGCVFLNVSDVISHLAQSAMVATGLISITYSISRVGPRAKPT